MRRERFGLLDDRQAMLDDLDRLALDDERRHSGDDERARVSEELKSTMKLIMAFETMLDTDQTINNEPST